MDGCPECRCLHFDFDRLIVGAHVGHHVRAKRRRGATSVGASVGVGGLVDQNPRDDEPGDILGGHARRAIATCDAVDDGAARVGFACKHLLQKVKGAASRLTAISSGYPDSEFSASEAERGAGEERDGCQTYVLLTNVSAAAVNSSANRGRAAFAARPAEIRRDPPCLEK